MRRSYKYRLRPNANQFRELGIMLETHRRLYNECLEWRKFAWEVYRDNLTFYQQRTWFSRQQKLGHPFYSRLNNASGNQTIARLDLAFKAFFRRVKAGGKPGYPRFKGKDRFDSIPFETYPNGLKLIGDRVRVQHLGTIRVVLHRTIPEDAKIKRATLKREGDHWYVVFSLELPNPAIMPSNNPPVGIDVGLEKFLAASDGHFESNPRYQKVSLPALRRAGRAVSRKKRGGSNRRKAVKRLRRIHNRTRDQRKDHHHKVANDLLRRYGSIAVERLNIQGMLRNGRLSRAISDAGWGSFIGTLRYKAESAGVAFVEVNSSGTSQECSGCGQTVPKPLSVRVHNCPHCGLSLDRDVNAARNILARAGLAGTQPAGLNVGHKVKRAPRSSSGSPISTTATNQAPRKKRVVKRPAVKGCLKTLAQPQLILGFEEGPCGQVGQSKG